MTGVRRLAGSVAVALSVTACGVEAQTGPEPVPTDRLPRLVPTSQAVAPAVRARVWGVREQRVVPVVVSLPGADLTTRLQALVDLARPGQQVRTAVAPGTRVVSVLQRDRLVVVAVSTEFDGTPEKDVPLALAQLVLTVMEQPGVEEVEVRVGQRAVGLVDDRGRPLARPLRRTDVESLVEGARTD